MKEILKTALTFFKVLIILYNEVVGEKRRRGFFDANLFLRNDVQVWIIEDEPNEKFQINHVSPETGLQGLKLNACYIGVQKAVNMDLMDVLWRIYYYIGEESSLPARKFLVAHVVRLCQLDLPNSDKKHLFRKTNASPFDGSVYDYFMQKYLFHPTPNHYVVICKMNSVRIQKVHLGTNWLYNNICNILESKMEVFKFCGKDAPDQARFVARKLAEKMSLLYNKQIRNVETNLSMNETYIREIDNYHSECEDNDNVYLNIDQFYKKHDDDFKVFKAKFLKSGQLKMVKLKLQQYLYTKLPKDSCYLFSAPGATGILIQIHGYCFISDLIQLLNHVEETLNNENQVHTSVIMMNNSQQPFDYYIHFMRSVLPCEKWKIEEATL